MGFPCGLAGKESTCNAGDLGSVLGLGRSPGEGKGYPLQYSGLENSMEYIVHGVANWCFWTVLLEKTLESPLDCKEIQPVHPKGNQSWMFIGRTDAEAEAPSTLVLDAKNWLIGKDPDPGKDWRQEEKGMTEDEIVGWHHQFDGHEFE